MATTIPPQVPPVQPVSSGLQPTVTVNNPPLALTQLSLGARIEGVIAGRIDAGQIQIQTSLGTLSVQTNFSLPQNAEVILQLLSLLPNVRLRIAAVGGNVATQAERSQPSAFGAGTKSAATGSEAGSQAGRAAGSAAPGAALSAPATAGSSFANLSVGATLTATLFGVPQGPSAITAGQSPVSTSASPHAAPTGQTTTQQVPGVTPPVTTTPSPATAVAGGARTTSSAPPATAGTATQNLAGGSTGGVAGAMVRSSTPPPTGSQFDVRIVAMQPAPPTVQSPPPAANLGLTIGSTLTATVMGTTTSGQPIIQTSSGVLTLATRSSLPTGTIITLEVASNLAPPKVSVPSADMSLRQVLDSRSWPALTELVVALQEVDMAQARHLLNTIIPRPDSQLAANILLFLVALRGGDVRAWLGETPGRALQRSKPGVLSRLSDEFAQLAQARQESLTGNWQMSLIPLFNGTNIDQIRLFMRRHGEETEDGEDGEPDGGVRFIIDLELDRLGRFQFDGLVQEKDKRFDLILRSAGDLPQHVSSDIRQIFVDACELTGINGGIVFQSGPSEFVEITPEATAENIRGLVV